jgi:adenine-specific DNA-methyltransferase
VRNSFSNSDYSPTMAPMSQSIARTLSVVNRQVFRPSAAPPYAQQEPKGVVYTKRWVVELLLDLAGYISSKNLVDMTAVEPAAGDGAFLGPMVERLVESCLRLKRPLSDCVNSIVAFELDEGSAALATTLCSEILRDKGIKPVLVKQLTQSWIKTGDYLFESKAVAADFVIGNPPYIRLEDIPERVAMRYRKAFPTMRGRADLYIAFYEAALRQLKNDGVCAFICADRWMRNQYGGELRRFVTEFFAVDVVIEMHEADAFAEEVDAYPAVTVIRRAAQGCAVVATAGADAGSNAPAKLAQALQACRERKGLVALPKGLRMATVDRWFDGAAPWPCQTPEQLALLRRLEDRFPPLEASAKVGIGVATGNDKVFVTQDANLVENSRLLKLAMARDLMGETLKWSGHYLVDPWNGKGLVDLAEYPRLERYFKTHAPALKKRHTAINNKMRWYKTIDRVTHALAGKPKLYIPDIKNVLHPVLDQGGTYPHHNLYFIESDAWDLEVLGGLLISAFGQFFVESYGVRMRGGYFRFQAQYLRRIRVPAPTALTKVQAKKLRDAYRKHDRATATAIALEVYGVDQQELERALGH